MGCSAREFVSVRMRGSKILLKRKGRLWQFKIITCILQSSVCAIRSCGWCYLLLESAHRPPQGILMHCMPRFEHLFRLSLV
jgi:hypothetical protein